MASSCFQFRKSDKKQYKELAKAGIEEVEIGIKEVENRNIHYTYLGKNSGKPLAVFIHGSPGSSSNFLHYLEDTALTNYMDVVLIDRPGFGYSDFGTSEPSISKQASMLSKIVNDFAYDKVVLIGHSLGGPIICRMAMDDTTIANALIIIAGSISADLEPKEGWRKPMNKPWTRWILPTSFRVSNQEIIPVKEELQQMEPLWSDVKIPVTIIQGVKDKLVPQGNAHYGEKVLINAEVKKVMIEKEGHFIPFDQPEFVIKEIKEVVGF